MLQIYPAMQLTLELGAIDAESHSSDWSVPLGVEFKLNGGRWLKPSRYYKTC